jgi:hypothetical protein
MEEEHAPLAAQDEVERDRQYCEKHYRCPAFPYLREPYRRRRKRVVHPEQPQEDPDEERRPTQSEEHAHGRRVRSKDGPDRVDEEDQT